MSAGNRSVSAWSGCWWVIRIADRPVMPSKPWEKLPGSNNTVVAASEPSPDWPGKLARRHECPKCVSCIPIF